MPATGDWTAFRLAAAELELGRASLEDMPAAALAALGAGCDSPTLALLAALDGAGWSEIEPRVAQVVEESGGTLSAREARRRVADDWLARVADGRLDPAARYDFAMTELLGELGGEYEWFRQALYDLDMLDAMGDRRRIAGAVDELRLRATLPLG
jgi:hypothetical protein